jgi:hypothetical protein
VGNTLICRAVPRRPPERVRTRTAIGAGANLIGYAGVRATRPDWSLVPLQLPVQMMGLVGGCLGGAEQIELHPCNVVPATALPSNAAVEASWLETERGTRQL